MYIGRPSQDTKWCCENDVHVLRQALEVLLLLGEPLLELEELLLLALADGVIFGSALATLEGVANAARRVRTTNPGPIASNQSE